MIVLVTAYLLLILLEVFVEGKFGDKHDFESGLRLIATILIAGILGHLQGAIFGAAIYLLLRVAIFDYSFAHWFRGDIFYLGNNFTDNLFKKVHKWVNLSFRIICLSLALYLTIKI
jgi:hypothetical protein